MIKKQPESLNKFSFQAAFNSSLRNYIAARIELLLEYTLSRNLSLALTMIGALFTLWIMVQGYLILTGRSQENLKAFIFNLGKKPTSSFWLH